jgi:ribosomal protein S18 acetylase RimI-like enzyme
LAGYREKMEIQELTPDDAVTVQELRLFALRESPAAFGSSYAEEADWPQGVIAARLEDPSNHAYGAFINDGRLIGMAVLRREQRVKSSHKASVFGLYVLPQHRRRGIGRALLETVISRASELGVRQVNLSVANANEAAVLLYESCGFERFGLEKDAFRMGGDFYDVAHMVLRLQGIE